MDGDTDERWCHVFVFEAILMYLDEGIPQRLMKLLADVAAQGPAILIFADSFLKGDERVGEKAHLFLEEAGWELQEYYPVRGYDLGRSTLVFRK